jgi:hypothetical protein
MWWLGAVERSLIRHSLTRTSNPHQTATKGLEPRTTTSVYSRHLSLLTWIYLIQRFSIA